MPMYVMASPSTAVSILVTAREYVKHSYFGLFVCGIIGHLLNFIVFMQIKRLRDNRWSFYFLVESAVGIAFLTISLINSTAAIVSRADLGDTILAWCRIRFLLFQGLSLTLFFTISCAACDQFCSTSFRFPIRHICTLKLVRSLIFTTSGIWFVHSIVFSCFLNIQPSFGCVITNAGLSKYSTYFFYPILYAPVQIVVSFAASLFAYRNVRQIVRRQIPITRRRLDQQMTAMILTRVVFFVLLALPYSVYRIYVITDPPSQSNSLHYATVQLTQSCFNFFFTLNYAASFYIFIATSSRYRHQVKNALVKCWRRWKRWYCTHKNKVVPVHIVSTTSNDDLD